MMAFDIDDMVNEIKLIQDFSNIYELTDDEKEKLTGFTVDQLQSIFSGLLCGINSIGFFSEAKRFNDYNFTPDQMNQIIDGCEKGVDYMQYATPDFDDLQMKLIKDGMINSLDIDSYARDDFSWEQMYQIFDGLKAGIDVYQYNDPNLSVIDMITIKKELLGEAS